MKNDLLLIDWCSHQAARYAVEHWHYSKSLPTPPIVKIGVWEKKQFIGCILFSRGANPDLGTRYGLQITEVAELTRVALTHHVTPVSQIIAFALKLLRKSNPSLRLVVSYADPNQGHIGGIYQAGGWIYTGQTAKSYIYKDVFGNYWHGRQVSSTGVRKQYNQMRVVPRISDCTKIPQLGKHRYLMPLDKKMRQSIIQLSQPYPKHAQET